MGAYINPADLTKEQWLEQNHEIFQSYPPASFDERPGCLPVCLVDNELFTAAGIAYDARELEAFTQPTDRRHKTWFWVNKEKLMDPEVSDLHYYMKDSDNETRGTL